MYTPSAKILEKYADVLVNFALGGGKGIKKGETVFLQVPESAKPILVALRRAVLLKGGYPITEYLPDDYVREFYELANEEQIKYFPTKLYRAKVDVMDHVVMIISETDKYELKGIDPKKMMARGLAFKFYQDMRNEKENRGKLFWTIGMYGTAAMAKDVGMTLKEYWSQIIKGCYLDSPNPIAQWRKTFSEVERLRKNLNSLDIRTLRVQAKDTDLTIGLDKNRNWLGGSGRNIPSFEIFISPDCRKTNGQISFSEPLYRYGNVVKGIKLEFKNGVVVKSSATEGEKVLKEMIKTKNADKVGEFSLTDSRFSKITKFMGETLFDENTGGKYGNTHIALGSAYKDSFPGDPSKVAKTKWEKMGYNDSSVHTDIISTTNRLVTATLGNGKELVIYKEGKFTI
jgi:aminopeptidase